MSCRRENPSEETIPESSQINELHETTKLLNEEVTFSNASAKECILIIYIYTEQTST